MVVLEREGNDGPNNKSTSSTLLADIGRLGLFCSGPVL
jgi:hypothetical protein